MKGKLAEFVGLLFFALVIVTLVRPNSVGPTAIREFGSAMTGLVKTATAP